MNVQDRLRTMRTCGERRPTEAEWRAFIGRAHPSLARRRVAMATVVTLVVAIAAFGGRALVDTPDGLRLPGLGPAGQDGKGRGGVLVPVEVWFVQGDRLYPTHQLSGAGVSVDEEAGGSSDEAALVADALERVLDGVPATVARGESPEVTSQIPSGIEVLEVEVGPETTVDLSGSMPQLPQARWELAMGQVFATLFQMEAIDSVWVMEEGLVATPAPVTREWLEGILPPIVVTSPAGTPDPPSFVGYVPASGTANVFEATVSYDLVTAAGDVLAEGFTTATCGTGCRGRFSKRIPFEVRERTLATLNLFESSAEDGSRLFEVSVPVYLCPAGGPSSDETRREPFLREPCGGG
ncbi:MAG: Gmad2 immunoglobulin-like domain-containing protein [Actinomycetota bacterium]